MGVFGALNTAVSGIRAQGSALQNISGNIANSQTVGFRRLDSNFSELVTGGTTSQSNQEAGGVTFSSRATNDIQGDIQASDIDTHIAIQGDGYFVVQQPDGVIDGETTFNSQDFFTRAGDFALTREGFLQNSSGFVLQGFNVDALGNTGSVLSPIQIDDTVTFPAVPTTEITISGNLPANPSTDRSIATADPVTGPIPGDELLDPALRTGANQDQGLATITGAQQTDFLETTIAGPSFEVFNGLGESFDVPLRFAKTSAADPTAGTVDTYNVYYQTNNNAGPTDAAFVRINQQFSFDQSGALTPAVPNVDIPNFSVNGSLIGTVQFNPVGAGFTQFDNGAGATVTALSNGSSAGTFEDVAISDGGRVTVTFSNNQSVDIAEIALASFNSDSGLSRIDGTAFAATFESGDPILGATGSVLAGQLETSNTDIADEFTKLIVTQQAFTANTRVVTTGDELLTAVINII